MKITTTASKGRALVLRQTTGTHGAAVRLATASVLAGIAAAASGGTAAAAPAAPLPTFTGSTSLQGMLLTEREVGTIVGARNLREVKSGNRLGDTDVQPSQCISAYAPFQAAGYADTDPLDVAFSVISDRNKKDLMVSEAVVQLPGKAIRHMEGTADAWADCKGQTVTTSDGQGWVMGAPRVNDDRTIVTLAQTSTDGSATCERAIAAHRDVFIDVMSCSSGRAEGQAAKVTQEIANKADSQPV